MNDDIRPDTDYGLCPGTVYLTDVTHRRVQLSPKPTIDPNDPLNWSQRRKTLNFGLTLIVTVVIFSQLSNQTVFWQQMIPDLDVSYDQLNNALAANYTGTACGGLIFIPFAIKYGRRPVYLASTAIMAALAFWTAEIHSVGELYTTNLLCGLAGSINETIVNMTIVDLFFVHQRSRAYALYSLAASVGSFIIPLVAGVQAGAVGWRWSYRTLAMSNAVTLVLFLCAFEETKYLGRLGSESVPSTAPNHQPPSPAPLHANGGEQEEIQDVAHVTNSYGQRLRFTTPSSENLWRLFYRPLEVLFSFPAVIFVATQFSFTLAWVAVMVSVQSIYMPYDPWNFNTTQIGLLGLPFVIGLSLGLSSGGWVGDKMIVYFARRNNGIYEPEMRLYIQFIPLVITTAGLLTFGLCLADSASWVTISAGTFIYTLGWGCGVNGTTYAMDSYTEITGEAFAGISFFRNVISVVVLFALSPWINSQGLRNMFITMAVVCFVVQSLYIPMIVFGKCSRRKTAQHYAAMVKAIETCDRE